MSEIMCIDEHTPLTDEQIQVMLRKTKIKKLADLMRQIKYPVFPNSTNWADFGIQFGSHVYEFVAEYLIDHGVEVDVVHCNECVKSFQTKINQSGMWVVVQENGDEILCERYEETASVRGCDFCSLGERRERNE